jgi:hypothetical protein
MTPEEFIAKWRGTTRTERSAAQEHFLDLCALLEVPKPGDFDRHGTEYTFEKSTRKIGDTQGFADVWKRHCFAWEYKGSRCNLVEAYAQLKQYADALENPPLLIIVSDMQEIRVHTNFTDTIAQQHVIPLAELRSVEARALLLRVRSGQRRIKAVELAMKFRPQCRRLILRQPAGDRIEPQFGQCRRGQILPRQCRRPPHPR